MKQPSKTLQDLKEVLNKTLIKSASKRNYVQNTTQMICNKYGFSYDIISDYISLRRDLDDVDNRVLFAITEAVLGNDILSEYFVASQISTFSNYKFHPKKIKYIENMVQVREGQWIGGIDLKFLMQLDDEQKIRYNDMTQRPLRHVINGNTEYYKIDVKQKMVDEIAESLSLGKYIPNTITLNIPPETIPMYEDYTLDISNVDHFDITDGFHRYKAARQIYNTNPDFEYRMELRITNFDIDTAKQFIWQEDQKTKMKKVNSDTYNINRAQNIIIQRIKGKPGIPLISNNEACINEAYLATAIRQEYLVGLTSREALGVVGSIAKDISEKFMEITAKDPSLLEKRWKTDYLIITIHQFKNYEGKSDQLLDSINKLYELKGDQKLYSYVNGGIRISKNTINRILEKEGEV